MPVEATAVRVYALLVGGSPVSDAARVVPPDRTHLLAVRTALRIVQARRPARV